MDSLRDKDVISHKEALEITKKRIQDILADPLLSDVPQTSTPQEIQAKIDLEQGKAFVVFLKREVEEGDQKIGIYIIELVLYGIATF